MDTTLVIDHIKKELISEVNLEEKNLRRAEDEHRAALSNGLVAQCAHVAFVFAVKRRRH